MADECKRDEWAEIVFFIMNFQSKVKDKGNGNLETKKCFKRGNVLRTAVLSKPPPLHAISVVFVIAIASDLAID